MNSNEIEYGKSHTDFEIKNDYTSHKLAAMSSHRLIRVHLKCNVFQSVVGRILFVHQRRQVQFQNNGIDFRFTEIMVSSK